VVVFGVAALIGVYLIWEAGLPALILGVVAILSALAYTGGPYPLAYHGWGEVFVLLFFGFAAVCGTYYVQAGGLSPAALLSSLPVGLLAMAILTVNNLRDIATDRASGKHTLAVRLGERGTVIEYGVW
ncbi:MAG: 1,4-dihydroxy-2-naphthoate octaprenyltransferase, partial [Bellilinea sp.]|nr:1,4-dihydroxy-2-naphthoate octaprenyltransferase [Bellilinea sp.]